MSNFDIDFLQSIGAIAETAMQVKATYEKYRGNISLRSVYRHLGKHSFVKNGDKKKLTQFDLMVNDISIGKRPHNETKNKMLAVVGARDGMKCCYCGGKRALQLDHINNNSKDSRIGNFQILCANCNDLKNRENLRKAV